MTLLGPPYSGKSEPDVPRAPVHGLVLAAGRGSRFDGGKLHARYHGRPLLSYALSMVGRACERGLLDAGHAVIDRRDDLALGLVHSTVLHPIFNDAPEKGISRSLRLGLGSLEAAPRVAAAVVFLGDQPQVRLDVIEELLVAWRGGSAVVRPRYASQPDVPGHPVLLPRSVWPRAAQLEGDSGFSALLGPGSSDTVLVDVPGDNPDVDTRADLQRLEGHPG